MVDKIVKYECPECGSKFEQPQSEAKVSPVYAKSSSGDASKKSVIWITCPKCGEVFIGGFNVEQ